MMKAQHTPGPWKYEVATRTIRSEPANYWLASMNSWDGAVNHEANARLIAAAPEMLEALKAVVREDFTKITINRWMQLIDSSLAAIAKAEGR
jgi:hypothetical protein